MSKSNRELIEDMEKRFIDVASIDATVEELNVKRLSKEKSLQVKTNKDKSKEHGEVFTPLWLVDKMLDRIANYDWENQNKTTMDMCAGYGQFTIRMIRRKYNLLGNKFKLKKFLTKTHYFNEIQLSSCYKLLYIFGKHINLFIGDSRQLNKLKDNDNGILFYSDELGRWINITDDVHKLYNVLIKYRTKFDQSKCDIFERDIQKIINEKYKTQTTISGIIDLENETEQHKSNEIKTNKNKDNIIQSNIENIMEF